jgi:hypothetical protein
MRLEAWLVMDQAALNVLWAQAHTDNPPENLVLLTNGIRGYWNDVTPDEVVNVIGTEQEIADFETLVGADLKSIDPWYQGQGVDYNIDVNWLTDPNRILSLMPDHQDDDPPIPVPPTFENPNWTHVFLGQPPDLKIFAGQYSTEFTTEFL